MRNYGATISEFGEADVLVFQPELPMPAISEQQVLIENHFAGINPVDFKTRKGLGWGAEKFKSQFPAVLGFDVAGIVAKAGKNSGFQVGDRVAALTFEGGCYARYVAVNADLVTKVPESVSLTEAGAMPTAAITAYQIVKQANLQAGQHILVSAPLGGVGHLLLQLLAQHQVKISVICSPAKNQAALKLGAMQCFDYHHPEQYPDLQADLFIDLVGGDSGVAALKMVKTGGRVICIPTIHVPLLQQAGAEQHLLVEKMLAVPNRDDLATMLGYLADHRLQLQIAQVFPISQIQQAHRALESGRTQGKIVLDLTDK
ncbi:quinone oxidoreductase [Gallibacterium genomosp. 3]|uniref:Quinone oxidoreductase n=1 Tax=Gallibacterium genomosp. 3 TaxID=505345 RepID=A0A1A7NRK7_9PAST|nr:NADP-dependent oxidoreductase [Gallibacterium genomosp. 3]OBW92156.1 quinone oxidoreductase [Gallibacterium genomosp. 3]